MRTVDRRDFLRNSIGSAALLAATGGRAFAANDKIQVGVIGTGARSHELMQALLGLPGVEIVAVTDAYKGRVARAIDRTEGRARAVASYPEMLAEKSIDAVVVATPDHWHKTMVVDALRAGKDVYCEKPLTFRSSDGLEIIRTAAETKRIVQVGSQGVSSDIQRKAREIIQSGKLGKVTMIRAAYNRNTASGAWIYPIPPDASPSTVNWDMFQGPAPKHPFSLERFFRWRCYWDYSGGIATDLFVHLCTTIHFLMNATAPARVVGMGELYRWKESRDVPDTLNAILEYPEGFTVNLSSTFNNQNGPEAGFQILGTEGSLAIGYRNLILQPEAVQEDNQWILDSWPKGLQDAYNHDPKVRSTEAPFAPRPKVRNEDLKFDGTDSTAAHMAHWLDSIRTRQPYWEDASAGHRAAACAHMVNQSVRERRMIEWDFTKNDIRS